VNWSNQHSGLPQPAQEHQDRERQLQPPPVPEDIARESEVPSEADGEQGQSDDGGDAPRSQNVPASSLLLWRSPHSRVGIHGSASSHDVVRATRWSRRLAALIVVGRSGRDLGRPSAADQPAVM
jgi:hypothetical protein